MYEKMNKLVRDNIPNIIEQKGDKPDFVILDSFDYYTLTAKNLKKCVLRKTKPTASLRTKYFLTVFIECDSYTK